jgi:hypothetical protein
MTKTIAIVSGISCAIIYLFTANYHAAAWAVIAAINAMFWRES